MRPWILIGLSLVVGCSDSGGEGGGAGAAGTGNTSGNGGTTSGGTGATGTGGSGTNGGSAGASGTNAGGSGGIGGGAGTSGSGGIGGGAGTSGSGGIGGSAGTAGSAGTGGTAGATCQPPRVTDACGCPSGFIGDAGQCVEVVECGGLPCPAGKHSKAVCNAAACDLQCQPGWLNCDTDPTNGCETLMDASNCGGCGQACASGQVCEQGQCVSACTFPATDCGGGCLDILSDPNACGACDHACPTSPHGTATCTSGTCGLACDSGSAACNGDCVDLQTDAENCGSCGNACPGAGSGNRIPGALAECSAGQCTLHCSKDRTLCNGACVQTSNDNQNCGACGTPCSGTCVAGVCEQNFDPIVAELGTFQTNVTDLVLDSGTLYWTSVSNTDSGKLSSMSLSDHVIHDLLTNQEGPRALAVDDTHVYIANTNGSAIYRVAKTGGARELVTVITNPDDVAVHGDSVYFRVVGEGKVYSALKTGSNPTLLFDVPITSNQNSQWFPVLTDEYALYAGRTIQPFAEGCSESTLLSTCADQFIAGVDSNETYTTARGGCQPPTINRASLFRRQAAGATRYSETVPPYRLMTEDGLIYQLWQDDALDYSLVHLNTMYRCGNAGDSRVLPSLEAPSSYADGLVVFDDKYLYFPNRALVGGIGPAKSVIARAPR
ncbi:MAG: hypothetical protein R3B89_28415 [Polyangiaceae bacterium]